MTATLSPSKLKSINQNYNRQVACIKKGKPAKYWDKKLATITDKRNRQVRDSINKAARFIINYCLDHRLGTLVFGWNSGNKTGINMGSKNNQEFVQISTSKLKIRIEQLCQVVGIQFVETEESYTSKASFIDNDFLPKYGEKPASWKPSGRRITRGQYQTAQEIIINADLNGAGNILRKVSAQLGLNLAESVRDVLTRPKRYNLFTDLSKLYRKRCEGVLLAPVATSA